MNQRKSKSAKAKTNRVGSGGGKFSGGKQRSAGGSIGNRSSSTSKSREKSSSHSGSGRSRSKRKVGTVAEQIGGGRSAGKCGRSASAGKCASGSGKSASGKSGRASRSAGRGRSAPKSQRRAAKPGKGGRSVQTFHTLQKSMFRSRLECQHTGTEPIAFHWTPTTDQNSATVTAPNRVDSVHCTKSLVGQSIRYRDDCLTVTDTDPHKSVIDTAVVTDKSPMSPQNAALDNHDPPFTVDELRTEIDRIESDDIFESGSGGSEYH